MEQRSTQPDSTQHRYQIGDRVRITFGRHDGSVGFIDSMSASGKMVKIHVRGDSRPVLASVEDIQHVDPPADIERLVEQAQRLGAVEFNTWVDAGLLCRRFITNDGSIDLTVRVK